MVWLDWLEIIFVAFFAGFFVNLGFHFSVWFLKKLVWLCDFINGWTRWHL